LARRGAFVFIGFVARRVVVGYRGGVRAGLGITALIRILFVVVCARFFLIVARRRLGTGLGIASVLRLLAFVASSAGLGFIVSA
jgi:hypothetical protein